MPASAFGALICLATATVAKGSIAADGRVNDVAFDAESAPQAMRIQLLPTALTIAAGLWFAPAAAAMPPADEPLAAVVARGELGYLAHCTICHGVGGLGVPGTYPPLAGSDWLAANREGAIRAVVSGLQGDITVNGRTYSGQMPAIIIDDETAADALTFVLNSWGNPGGRVTAAEVRKVRARTPFKTYEQLRAAGDFRPLPAAPPGFTLREVARLPDFATRLASDGRGRKLYVLGQSGSVWRFDLAAGSFKPIASPKDLGVSDPSRLQTLGLALDAGGRLWLTANHRIDGRPLVLNQVTVFRTTGFDAEGDPVGFTPWLQAEYPYGIGSYNHGISDIRFGPDGMLYVSSGSRTDGGEEGGAPHFGRMGEVDLTAAVWRLDPGAAKPRIEVIARGIRNAYSLGWDGGGNLFTISNGPDANAPEEMDYVMPPAPGGEPRHHGFPYQLADIPAGRKWYAHTPDPPPGLAFALPVVNLGPAALLGDRPTSTFSPHSSPAGLVWLDDGWPAAVRNRFLIGRFGNFLAGVDTADTGFDLLLADMERRNDGTWAARMTTFVAPLARPIDLHVAGRKIYILEYTRVPDFSSQLGRLPGRILELALTQDMVAAGAQ